MKTMKWKSIAVVLVTTVIAAFGISDFAIASNPLPSDKIQSIKQHKQVVKNDVVRVQIQQNRVSQLEKQCCARKSETGKPTASRTDLLKAKADLQREKAYLAADKKTLLAEHRSVITAHQKAVRTERADVAAAKAKLFAALFKVKPSNVTDAQTVVDASNNLHQRQTALKTVRQNRNDDLLAINKDIREVKGQNVLVLGAEDASVKIQALALK